MHTVTVMELRVIYRLLCSTLLMASTLSQACLWDRDTLAREANRFPGMLDVIVGRFDRNPPKYYEMRIDRLLPVYKSGQATLAQLDDLAVAYDRIGKDDEAIKVMAAKAKLLKAKPDVEHQYRYHANLGTFQVHKWLHDGAAKDNLSLVEESWRNIAAALKIHPNAHFGREATQLRVIECLIATEKGKEKNSLGEVLSAGIDSDNPHAKGLAGLIVLGNAWESIDIYDALATILSYDNDSHLGQLALLRAEELRSQGQKSLMNAKIKLLPGYSPMEEEIPFIKDAYVKLRKNADEYVANRTAFMEKQFAKGKHPDTDTDFWEGYKEVPRIVIPKTGRGNPDLDNLIRVLVALPAIIGAFLIYRILRRTKKQAPSQA